MFAFTRLKWDAHLDMILIMLAPGGLGMLLPLLWLPGPVCHAAGSSLGLLTMSAGMLLFTVPWNWFCARCILQARHQGHGRAALLFDTVGMQLGMGLSHVLLSYLPTGTTGLLWLHHAIMLAGMLVGMIAALIVTTSVQSTIGRVLPDDSRLDSLSRNQTIAH